jgi:2,3-dimethylmalate lyase
MTTANGWLARRLLDPNMLVLPGAHDALTAKLIAQSGAEAIYAGGFAATAAQYGLPDIGYLGLAEMTDIFRRMVAAAGGCPVIVDGDTGHGGLLAVQRTVRMFADAGITACHIEDQTSPKRCGHLAGKDVVARDEAIARIGAAVEAARPLGFGIIARTDAVAVQGFEEAIARARAFLETGAQAVFIDNPVTLEQVRAIPPLVGGAVLFNAATTGNGPHVPNADLAAMGYRIVIHPIELLLKTTTVARQTVSELTGATFEGPVDFQEINTILGTASALDNERRLAGATSHLASRPDKETFG